MIRLVAILDADRGLACEGKQPVTLPNELATFKTLVSQSGVVVAGRTTIELGGYPIGTNPNVMLSKTTIAPAPMISVRSLDELLLTYGSDDIWITGGANVYSQAILIADELHVTHMSQSFGCDLFFPVYDDVFEEVSRGESQTENTVTYYTAVYRRKVT